MIKKISRKQFWVENRTDFLKFIFNLFVEQAGDTLLSLAVGAGFEEVVTMLLQRGADVNWVDTKVMGSNTHLIYVIIGSLASCCVCTAGRQVAGARGAGEGEPGRGRGARGGACAPSALDQVGPEHSHHHCCARCRLLR